MSERSKLCLAALVCIVIAIAAAHPAWAQPGRGGFRRMFGVAKAQLATLPEVQDALKLSDKQKARVAEINDELGEKRRALWGTGFGRFKEIRGELETLNAEAAKSVDAVLDEPQRKRLDEITIQQNGARSLVDPSVVAQLGLTENQQSALKAVAEENSQAFENAFAEGGREGWRQRAEELAEEGDKKMLAVLTDEQKQKFELLHGEAFEVDLSSFFRRGQRGR